MDNSNIKVYLAVSGALIVLLILIIVIPFSSKKTRDNKLPTTNSLPLPTTVQTNSTGSSLATNKQPLVTVAPDFTGAIDEPIPQNIIDISNQKKDLQLKIPLSLSTFTIDFDYSEDKFIVTLKDPKDQAQKEFESWRTANYSALGIDQFILK